MAIPVAHFVSQADHCPHAEPPSTGRAPLADSDYILTREEGEQPAIAIPNARVINIAKATATPSWSDTIARRSGRFSSF